MPKFRTFDGSKSGSAAVMQMAEAEVLAQMSLHRQRLRQPKVSEPCDAYGSALARAVQAPADLLRLGRGQQFAIAGGGAEPVSVRASIDEEASPLGSASRNSAASLGRPFIVQ